QAAGERRLEVFLARGGGTPPACPAPRQPCTPPADLREPVGSPAGRPVDLDVRLGERVLGAFRVARAPFVHRVPGHSQRLGDAEDAEVALGHGRTSSSFRPPSRISSNTTYGASPSEAAGNIVSQRDDVGNQSRARRTSHPPSSAAAAQAASTPSPAQGPIGRLATFTVVCTARPAFIGARLHRNRCQPGSATRDASSGNR